MKTQGEKTYWPIEGAAHDNVGRDSIYINHKVKTFLDLEKEPIIIASKGMGKTLLLRSKKKILEDRCDGQIIIPRDQEYDEPKIFGTLPRSYAGFKSPEFWTDLWRASILFSILTHGSAAGSSGTAPGDSASALTDLLDRLPLDRPFIDELSNDISHRTLYNPSHYLGALLMRGTTVAEKLRRAAYLLQTISQRMLHSGVCVFIDAFDQTLTDHFASDLEVWRNAQIGLVLASHYLNTENNHIKVFASIRQEAFAGYFGQHREVIKGKAILLDYAYEELREMFETAVQLYSPYRTIEAFLGCAQIRNDVFQKDENSFAYIYRHSSGTPRSIMYLGQVLSNSANPTASPDVNENKIKQTVNQMAARSILEDYWKGQKAIFLKTLCDDSSIATFLSLIPTNILNVRAMRAVNRHFAQLRGLQESDSHPFCELYNIGLLGTHRAHPATLRQYQRFKKPNDFDWKQAEMIQADGLYFIHPALHGDLVDSNPHYRINRRCLIGDGNEWPCAPELQILPRIFLSHSSLDRACPKSAVFRTCIRL